MFKMKLFRRLFFTVKEYARLLFGVSNDPRVNPYGEQCPFPFISKQN